ncbi:hypothetical protein HMPREF9103_01086 [Lentilactobacillus parafarraginis F0439]|uniref:Uncharacterized protein n=1 Tax=Lentilactobacillus parafarraginis F0439 TaxID=797515 RepID=G9ZMY6_9LACO|nr:hypothetical protein HMPREF9103_01086 [Lentilactobacillus parafarraginis F0439]
MGPVLRRKLTKHKLWLGYYGPQTKKSATIHNWIIADFDFSGPS